MPRDENDSSLWYLALIPLWLAWKLLRPLLQIAWAVFLFLLVFSLLLFLAGQPLY